MCAIKMKLETNREDMTCRKQEVSHKTEMKGISRIVARTLGYSCDTRLESSKSRQSLPGQKLLERWLPRNEVDRTSGCLNILRRELHK